MDYCDLLNDIILLTQSKLYYIKRDKIIQMYNKVKIFMKICTLLIVMYIYIYIYCIYKCILNKIINVASMFQYKHQITRLQMW